MKKKSYLQPETQIVILQMPQTLLTGSTMTVDVHDEDYDTDEMTSLSRGHRTVWDDDEKDDMYQ
jgi:hypothetical protein